MLGMNDPCAPGYDPSTGLYHMFYQWSPHTHYWQDISWGHATSRDMLNWDHDSQDSVRRLTTSPGVS
jgi:beta-fructofuranosidase